MFPGNKDSNTINRNEVPLPTVVTTVMVMETSSHNNFAVRMELFGCEPGGFGFWLFRTSIPEHAIYYK